MRRTFKVICVIMAIIMISGTAAFAAEFGAPTDRLQEISNLAKKHGVSITEKPSDLGIMYEFQDMREFEKFLSDINKNKIKQRVIEEAIAPNNDSLSSMLFASSDPPTYNGIHNSSHYISGLAWMNLTLTYTYQNIGYMKYFRDVKNLTTNLSGLTIGLSWTQTGYAANIVDDGQIIEYEVHGYLTVGVKIGDYPIGAVIPDDLYGSVYWQ